MILPVIVLGCKSDRTPAIEPGHAQAMLKTHDTGLIEVSAVTSIGKEKMKKSFQYLLKAVCRQRSKWDSKMFAKIAIAHQVFRSRSYY